MLRHLEGASRDLRPPGSQRGAQLCADAPAGVTVNRVGSMFTFFFTDSPVTDYESAKRSDTARFGRFFRAMLERGIYLAPSQFEAAFVSAAHTEADIDADHRRRRAKLSTPDAAQQAPRRPGHDSEEHRRN